MLAEDPKITDWMQAWGSLAGLVMSTIAVIFTGLLLRHEIRVRREERRDNEAAQARLIVGRVVGPFRGTSAYGTPVGDILGYEWEVANHSEAPVFNLRIRLIDPAGNLVLRVVEDGEELDYQSVSILDKTERRRWVLASSIEKAEPVRIVVEYTDTNGLMWGRSGGSRPWRIRFSALLPRRRWLGHR